MTALLGAGATHVLLVAAGAAGVGRRGLRHAASGRPDDDAQPGPSLAGDGACRRPGRADAGPDRGGHPDPRRRGQCRQRRDGLRQAAGDDRQPHAARGPLRRSGTPAPVRSARARPAPRDAGGGVAGRGQLPAIRRGQFQPADSPEGVELTPAEVRRADFQRATPGYFESMRIPVIDGRGLTRRRPRRCARRWPWSAAALPSAIGRGIGDRPAVPDRRRCAVARRSSACRATSCTTGS